MKLAMIVAISSTALCACATAAQKAEQANLPKCNVVAANPQSLSGCRLDGDLYYSHRDIWPDARPDLSDYQPQPATHEPNTPTP